MPQLGNIEDFDQNREMVRQSRDAISADIGMAMRDAGLGAIPTYIVLSNSGNALAMVMTPLDPSQADWDRVMEIACQVIQAKLGTERLHTREMAWVMANDPSGAADVTAGPIGEPAISAENPVVTS
jgi:hypothetical protein